MALELPQDERHERRYRLAQRAGWAAATLGLGAAFAWRGALLGSALRALAVYALLLAVFRLAGKRTMAETTPFDLILLLIISETTQQGMVGDDKSLANAAVLILTLVGADLLLAIVKQRWPGLDKTMEGLPLLLVSEGRVLEERLAATRVDRGDLLAAARRHGLESLEGVRYAVLENSGEISIIPDR